MPTSKTAPGRDEYHNLSEGKIWIQRTRIRGDESVVYTFNNNTELDPLVMEAIRKHGAWHLYCSDLWAGGDLSVFEPVADIVEKISLSSEKGTKIIGLDCLINVKQMSVGGDVSAVDFTKFKKLLRLNINEQCKGGNWHVCESLDDLFVDVSLPNLTKLTVLRRLRSLGCGRGLKSFDGISELAALRDLRVGGCHLSSLASLGRLPKLRLLMLNLMPKLESLKGIEGLHNLEELDVTQCGGLRDVSSISALTKLKKLKLAFCPHIKSLDSIKLPKGCKVAFEGRRKVGDGFWDEPDALVEK